MCEDVGIRECACVSDLYLYEHQIGKNFEGEISRKRKKKKERKRGHSSLT